MNPGIIIITIALLVLAGGVGWAAVKTPLKTPQPPAEIMPRPEPVKVSASGLDAIYQKYGLQYGVDWRLIKAIAQVESSENPAAVNPADPSYGLMQILCQDNGYGGCSNKFNITDWPPSTKNKLFDPDYNVKIGSQILAWNIKTYGRNKGIAVYNSWSARNDPTNGPYRNQTYVDKVIDRYVKIT